VRQSKETYQRVSSSLSLASFSPEDLMECMALASTFTWLLRTCSHLFLNRSQLQEQMLSRELRRMQFVIQNECREDHK
jgi:hypothetical protein